MQQKEILTTKAMLERFKSGEDIEKIFNTLRPKYPIKRYKEVFGYNNKMDLQNMLQEVKSSKKLTKNKIAVGTLEDRVVEFLEKRDIPIHTKEIYLTSKGLSHLSRDSKKNRGAGLSDGDILNIPSILKSPSDLYFDKGKQRFNIIYCDLNNRKCIKIAVDTKAYSHRKEAITIIKTAGYIKKEDMNDIIFEKI